MKKGLNLSYNLLVLLILYSLFAFSSLKTIGAPVIDGIKGNNLIYLTLTVLLIRLIFMKKNRSNLRVFICIFIVLSYQIISLLFYKNSQSIYSIVLMLLPVFLISTSNEYEGKKFKTFLKLITILSIIYSIFVLLEFFSYDFFSSHFSLNTTASYVTRHATMLGTSITTSYFFVLNIPFEVIASKLLDKNWKKLSYFAIILNVIAIIINQSRICFITLGVYFILYFFHFNKKIKFHYKVIIVLLVIILMAWVLNNNSLSRLYTSYNDSVSTETRVSVLKTGIDEFSKHPLFGSGISKYYKRIWNSNSRFVYINGNLSLVDPHNLFIFVLVEQGIVGFILYGYLLFTVKKEYYNKLDNFLKKNLRILIIGLIIIFCGGSHLINEINFSVLFWIYFTALFSYSISERSENK